MMLSAFREFPGRFSIVATKCHTDPRTAKKAWEEGWQQFEGGRSMSKLIELERVEARAAIRREELQAAETAAKSRKEAREQALAAQKQEGLMVTLARGASSQALSATMEMLRSARDLGARAKAKLDLLLKEDDLARVDPTSACPACGRGQQMPIDRVVELLGSMANVAAKVINLSHNAMVMERLHLGRPTDIIGVEIEGKTEGVTVAEASGRLTAAARALESAARRGKLIDDAPGKAPDVENN